MPNAYHYFQSGEVSHERLLLEIEVLKQLRDADLLQDMNWNAYDTPALKLFHRSGIEEVNKELIRRYGNHSNQFEQCDFIQQCIRKHQRSRIKENFKQQRISFPLVVNIIFIFICLFFVIGLFIYEDMKFHHQHHLFKSLDHPLTTKRRQLTFTDDLTIILLTFTSAIILGSIIMATRASRKIILLGIIAFLMIIIFLFIKCRQIITFLAKYRELRWPMLYDYMYS
jgi:hypothetical protein